MPDHFYAGPPGRAVGLRDAENLPVGDVEPGDVRPFAEPPSPEWLPVEGNEDHAALAAGRDARDARVRAAIQAASAGTGGGDEGGTPAAPRAARRTPPVPDTTPADGADASGQTPEEQP
jgi:hypothetical protein